MNSVHFHFHWVFVFSSASWKYIFIRELCSCVRVCVLAQFVLQWSTPRYAITSQNEKDPLIHTNILIQNEKKRELSNKFINHSFEPHDNKEFFYSKSFQYYVTRSNKTQTQTQKYEYKLFWEFVKKKIRDLQCSFHFMFTRSFKVLDSKIIIDH